MLGSRGRAASWPACLWLLCLPSCASPSATAPGPSAPSDGTIQPLADDSEGKGPFETCYSTFSPSGDAAADLARLTRNCGPAGGMRAISAVHQGTQGEQDPVERLSFEVPAGGKCYRVYAVGDGGVKDLDLLLRGASGDGFVADVTHDAWPVLPPREPVCLTEPGLYLLEVSVARGQGRYALQVWGR